MSGALQPGLKAFMTVAEQKSFSKAAELLGVSPSALSQTVKSFEEALGIRVLHRTTRSVSLTEAGQRLLDRIRPVASELETALQDAKLASERPSGVVRIKSPKLAFQTYVESRIAGFNVKHPDIVLDVTIDDAVVDLVAGKYDIGIIIGEVIEKDMVAVRLGPDIRHVAIAAPSYLASFGVPKTPKELAKHKCLRWRWAGETNPYVWEFFENGAWFNVEVSGPLVVTDYDMLLRAAVEGVGIAFCPDILVRTLLDSGKVVEILKEWSAPFPGYFMAYPQQRQMAPALRAFIDFMKTS
jgi:DNA-binding transcriptional LysR family regulator